MKVKMNEKYIVSHDGYVFLNTTIGSNGEVRNSKKTMDSFTVAIPLTKIPSAIIGKKIYLDPILDNVPRCHRRVGTIVNINKTNALVKFGLYSVIDRNNDVKSFKIGDKVHIFADPTDSYSDETATVTYINPYGSFIGVRGDRWASPHCYAPYQLCKI